MAPVDKIEIELTMQIGQAVLPLRQLLRKSRGTVIPLGRGASEPLEILANGRKIAEGRVVLRGEEIGVELIGRAQKKVQKAV